MLSYLWRKLWRGFLGDEGGISANTLQAEDGQFLQAEDGQFLEADV